MYKNYQSQLTVFLGITICFIYSLAFNQGFYGYSVDYWVIYHKPNLNWAKTIFDVLGWHIATLSVSNVHIGVLVTSLLLSVSSFLLVIKTNIPKNGLFVILGFILLLHTWPILMPATNGMRQGIMMSFIFLALVSLDSNKILTLTFLLLSVFSHNTGIGFGALFLGVWISINFFKNSRYLLVATVVVGNLFIVGGLILLDQVIEGGSKVINGDYRYPFLVINSSVAMFLLYKGPTNFLSLYVFYLNSFFPHQLSNWALALKKRLIHFSTDCVFSGSEGSYLEDTTPNALDYYGKTKGLGEINSKSSLTIRSSMIGPELFNKTELFEWVINNKVKEINGFSRVMYSGVTTAFMARLVTEIIENHKNLNGIYNVASKPISKFELLHLINDNFDLGLIINEDKTVISNKTLNASKLEKEIGQQSPSWDELIFELKKDYMHFIDLYKTK